MIRTTAVALLLIVALALTACGNGAADPGPVTLAYEFEGGSDGWASDFSDFSDQTPPEDPVSETGIAPPGLEDEGTDFFHLAATNRSDDLFSYIFVRIPPEEGLLPNKPYTVDFTVRFASDAPSGCFGVGGAPGESVWMKVGASAEKPVPVSEGGETRMNVDKGNQSSGGADADVAGVIANGIPCEEALEMDPPPYALVTLQKQLTGAVTTDSEGALYLFVGIDSGFESRTSIFYDRIEVTLTPAVN